MRDSRWGPSPGEGGAPRRRGTENSPATYLSGTEAHEAGKTAGHVMSGLDYHAKHSNFTVGFENHADEVGLEKLEIRGMT